MSVRSVSKPQGFRPTLLLRVSLESEIERIVNVESQDFRPTLLSSLSGDFTEIHTSENTESGFCRLKDLSGVSKQSNITFVG